MKTVIDLVNLIKDKFSMRKDIAPVETSSTASRAYKAGEEFYYGNLLQRATQDITQGSGLAGGVNFENADPVAVQVVSVKETLTNQVAGLLDNDKVNGAVNILPFDLNKIKAINTSGSWSNNVYTVAGISFTVEGDGTVKANGTATGYAEMQYYYKAVPSIVPSNSNKYKLTGCPAGGSSETYQMFARSNSTQVRPDYGDGVILDIADVLAVAMNVKSGQTVSNLVFKPMISLTSMNLKYNDYVPYAKSNKELTEDVETLKSGQLNSSIEFFDTKTMNIFWTSDAFPSDWSNLTTQEATDIAQALYDFFKKIGGSGSKAYEGVMYMTSHKKSDGSQLGNAIGICRVYSNASYSSMLSNNSNARFRMTYEQYGSAEYLAIALWGNKLQWCQMGVNNYGLVDNKTRVSYNTISTYKG